MKKKSEIFDIAIQTFKAEAAAIQGLTSQLTDDFYLAIEHLSLSKDRVIITGIGKSALIAQKIVATFNSTGTPAIFMHAAMPSMRFGDDTAQ